MQRLRPVILLLGLILGLFSTGQAKAELAGGIAAYQRGDYETALRVIGKAAERRDPQALYNLGVLYAEGKAVPRDMNRAVALYREGAERGSVLAAFNLAQTLRKGDGVAVDFAQAARWYTFAAKRGDFRAGNELGLLYVEGKGVRKDLVEGFAWIYPATHAEIMDDKALANAVQLARMLTRDELQEAQQRGRRNFDRYIKPNQALVRTLLGP